MESGVPGLDGSLQGGFDLRDCVQEEGGDKCSHVYLNASSGLRLFNMKRLPLQTTPMMQRCVT